MENLVATRNQNFGLSVAYISWWTLYRRHPSSILTWLYYVFTSISILQHLIVSPIPLFLSIPCRTVDVSFPVFSTFYDLVFSCQYSVSS